MNFLHSKTNINIFSSEDTLFNFENKESKKSKSQQLIDLEQNKDDYEQFSLNILDHSRTSIWISKNGYDGPYQNWDGGVIAFVYIKKEWKYKDKFIELLNESCSLWNQFENGSFDWVMKLTDEEVKSQYWEMLNQDECNCHNCVNCVFKPSIEEMRNKINELEVEFYVKSYQNKYQ